MRRSCCVLDVDETLVHTFVTPHRSSYNTPALGDRIYHIKVDGTKMWGIKRPYLSLLIDFLFNYFDTVGVWSAGTREYIEELLPIIFGDKKDRLLFVWTRENCLEIEGTYYKPLDLLFRKYRTLSKHNTLILDDRVDVSMYNLEHHVMIPLFSPSAKSLTLHDDCLVHIVRHFREAKKPYLLAIKSDDIFEDRCGKCNEKKAKACKLDETVKKEKKEKKDKKEEKDGSD